MKTICWITSWSLLQVDVPLLCHLKNHFSIGWVVYADPGSDMARYAKAYADENGMELTLLHTRSHRYNPLVYFEYREQMRILRDRNADIYYIDCIPFPYLIFAIRRYLPVAKTVMAMHHGKAPASMDFRRFYQRYLDNVMRQPFTFQFFSESQGAYFTGDGNRKYVIPLSLNDYGRSVLTPPDDRVVFLYFGIMVSSKFIDGIILAAQRVMQRTDKPFVVKMVGYCRNWQKYQSLIEYPELFELDIKRIPESDIPDLLSTAHYQLLPYTWISQSGALRMAYGYNLPVITSDEEGFRESVVDGITGRLCKAGDVESLAQTMLEVIENHPDFYNEIKKKQQAYVSEHYSQKNITESYVRMFNEMST